MADQKLTDRTKKTVMPANALIHYVDQDDNAQDPAGSSFSMEWQDALAAVPALSKMVVTEEIARLNNTTSSTFTFDNIQASETYDQLIIEADWVSDRAASLDVVNFELNADTTNSNYHWQRIYLNDASLSGDEDVDGGSPTDNQFAGYVATTNGADNRGGGMRLVINGPNSSRRKQALITTWVEASTSKNLRFQLLQMTTAVTTGVSKIVLTSANSAEISGDVVLYGVRTIAATTFTGRVLLQEITHAAASESEFDFNNIPGGYRRLILKGAIRSTATATKDQIYMFYNEALTAGDYHHQLHNVEDGATHTPSEDTTPYIGVASAANSTTDSLGHFEIVIEDYDQAKLKIAKGQSITHATTDFINVANAAHVWANTATITRIRLRTDNHATDLWEGTVALYGEM